MTSAGFQFSPGVFAVKDADPEQTLERFERYVEAMKKAFRRVYDMSLYDTRRRNRRRKSKPLST